MNRKVLIAYASRSGSTAEVAAAIGKTLRAMGLAVEIQPAADVRSLDGFHAIVIGSGVRFGAWLDPALDFLKRHRAVLTQRPVAFFSVHMFDLDQNDANRIKRAGYTAKARALVTPKLEAFFAGALIAERLSFFDKLAVRIVKAPLEDRRDWRAIEAWARALPVQLD